MDEIEQLFGQSSAHPARHDSSDSPWALLILLIGILIFLFLLTASGYVINFSEKESTENHRSLVPKMSPVLAEVMNTPVDVPLDQHVDIYLPQIEINYVPSKKEDILKKEINKEESSKEEEKKNLFLRLENLFTKHSDKNSKTTSHGGRRKSIRHL